MEYTPKGVCSQRIQFEVENDTLHNVMFTGGCNGNTQGIGKLVEGMNIHDAVARLEGIRCGFKSTSCPDQLAQAIKQYIQSQE